MLNYKIPLVVCGSLPSVLSDALVCEKRISEYIACSFEVSSVSDLFSLAHFQFAGIATDHGLFLVDAGACISELDFSSIFQQIGIHNSILRVRESSSIQSPLRPLAATLGWYFPPDKIPPMEELHKYVGARLSVTENVLQRFSSADFFIGSSGVSNPHSQSFYIESMASIAEFEKRLLLAKAYLLANSGVRIHDLNTTYIRGELRCGVGVELNPNVLIEGVVALESGVTIGAGSILRDCTIGLNTCVNPNSIIEGSIVGSDSFIGPFARLRPDCIVGDKVQIGNYVEIKKSKIGSGCRINHHSFIGDAFLGEMVTIGAGTITCNHNGREINSTSIGEGAYIGSGCNLIAPLHIGRNSFIGAGSTITSGVQDGEVVIARARQAVASGSIKAPDNE
jgi:NDP-sugar pyrophosphorylase family protein